VAAAPHARSLVTNAGVICRQSGAMGARDPPLLAVVRAQRVVGVRRQRP
jgi:hypothetical protein